MGTQKQTYGFACDMWFVQRNQDSGDPCARRQQLAVSVVGTATGEQIATGCGKYLENQPSQGDARGDHQKRATRRPRNRLVLGKHPKSHVGEGGGEAPNHKPRNLLLNIPNELGSSD